MLNKLDKFSEHKNVYEPAFVQDNERCFICAAFSFYVYVVQVQQFQSE